MYLFAAFKELLTSNANQKMQITTNKHNYYMYYYMYVSTGYSS